MGPDEASAKEYSAVCEEAQRYNHGRHAQIHVAVAEWAPGVATAVKAASCTCYLFLVKLVGKSFSSA